MRRAKECFLLLARRFIWMMRGERSTEYLKKRGLKVGINFSRQGGCKIDESHCFLIEIGDNVTLAPRVHIIAHDASLSNFLGIAKVSRVSIGNNVFIGAGSIVLPGVKIGNNVIVGAGSVVSKDILSDSVFAGNPAKFICSINDYLLKHMTLFKEKPFFDKSYDVLTITADKSNKMVSKLDGQHGYCETARHQELHDKRNGIKAKNFG